MLARLELNAARPFARGKADGEAPLKLIRQGIKAVAGFLTFDGAVSREPKIEEWFDLRSPDLAAIARRWFNEMRGCGADVTELLHDGHPTACVGDAAFGYVNVFTSHVNIGFFNGASLPDPACILEGTGKFMRHVKAKPGALPPEGPLQALIGAAYQDIKAKRAAEGRALR